MNTKSNSSCGGFRLFDDSAKHDARTRDLYDGVPKIQKGTELYPRSDYQGAEALTEPHL